MGILRYVILLTLQSIVASRGTISDLTMDRKEACEDISLPKEYAAFLDTDFLGPEKSVAAGKVNFSYHRFGPLSAASKPGKTLVMIVGMGCTKSTWTPDLLKTLAATREVLIFDNRGSGRSTDADPLSQLTVESLAASTLELLDVLDIKQPDILGWSMGGVIALHIATHSSEAASRFIIVNSAAPKPVKPSGNAFYSKEWPINLWQGMLDPVAFFPDTTVGNAGLCRYVKLYSAMPKDGVTRDVVRAQREAIKAAYQSPDIYDRLGEIESPVLILVGTHAGEGPGTYDLLSKLQTAVLTAFSDAAHGAVFQHSLLVAATIDRFLETDFDLPEANRAGMLTSS